MGFNAELLVLYPDRQLLGREKILWRVDQVISFGYITRLEKLMWGERDYGPHARTGICLVSCILEKLIDKLRRGPQWPDFAPLFLVSKNAHQEQQVYNIARSSDRKEYIDRGICYTDIMIYGKIKNPDIRQMKAHNEALAWDQSKLNGYVANEYNIIVDSLVMWESCANVATWLDKAEEDKTPEWEQLEKNSVSLAKARGWREFLREVGKVEARVLFLFPKY